MRCLKLTGGTPVSILSCLKPEQQKKKKKKNLSLTEAENRSGMKKAGDPSTEMHCIVNQQCVYRQKSQTKTTTHCTFRRWPNGNNILITDSCGQQNVND